MKSSDTRKALEEVKKFAGDFGSPGFEEAMSRERDPLRPSASDPSLVQHRAPSVESVPTPEELGLVEVIPESAPTSQKQPTPSKKAVTSRSASSLHKKSKRSRKSTPQKDTRAPTASTTAERSKSVSVVTTSKPLPSAPTVVATPARVDTGRGIRVAAFVASQRLEEQAKPSASTPAHRPIVFATDSEEEAEPTAEDPDASTKPKHPKDSKQKKSASKPKPKSKGKSLSSAVKELEGSLSSTTTSDLSSSEPTLAEVARGSKSASESKGKAKKSAASTSLKMAARKELPEASASASKPRPDTELEDESWANLPHYISVYSRGRMERDKKEPLYLDIKSSMAHCIQMETGFLSQDGFDEVFERGCETLRKWNASIRKFLMDSKVGSAISSFVKSAKWKLIVKWPRWLFRAYGPRFATPEERAAFNFIQSLQIGLVDSKRVDTKLKDSIGRPSKWLDASADHLLSPQDLWNRIRIDLNICDLFCSKVVVLRGTDPSVIIAEGLANAILVFRLINEYCYQLNKVRGKILFIELADAGLFDLSVTARDLSSWHCGFDAFAIAALDIEMKERANIVSPQRSFLAALSGTHRLLGDVPYSVGRDIVLVECSCSEDVLERAKGESAKSIGKNLQLWKQSNPEWRIPVVLEFGSTSVAFKGEPPKTDAEAVRRAGDLDKLINEIALIAGEHGIETNADPLKIANASDYRDGTLEACQADIDMYGACRVFSNLDETTWIPDPLPLRIAQRNVLIVCAQVALLQGPEERPGVPIYFPRVVKLVLANAYGRVLVYHVDMEDTGIYPEGYVDAQLGSRKEWRYMRSSILEYLGKNGILVGFGVSWVLTALQLALDATRVIEIGEEPAFQRWCRQLAVASKTPQLADHMTPNLKIPYDARWPAVLQPDPLDLAPEGRPDIFRFAFYTAAVWQSRAYENCGGSRATRHLLREISLQSRLRSRLLRTRPHLLVGGSGSAASTSCKADARHVYVACGYGPGYNASGYHLSSGGGSELPSALAG